MKNNIGVILGIIGIVGSSISALYILFSWSIPFGLLALFLIVGYTGYEISVAEEEK